MITNPTRAGRAPPATRTHTTPHPKQKEHPIMATTPSKPFRGLAENLEAVRQSLEVIARNVNADHDLTDAGKDSAWQKYTAPHRTYVAQVEVALETISTAVDKAFNDARAAALPTATTDTGKLVAEMELARIIGRGIPDSVDGLYRLVTGLGASPTRTALIEELEARGRLTTEMVSGILKETSPEVAAATEMGINHARIASVFGFNLRTMYKVLDDRKAAFNYWSSITRADADYDMEVPVTVFVPAWQRTQAETLWGGR